MSTPGAASPRPRARVLLLADDRRDHASTLLEHIHAIRTMSRHDVRLYNPRDVRRNRLLGLGEFDVVIVHYSLMILSENYLPADVRGAIGRFTGLKIQFIQDDYRQVEAMREQMRNLGIDVLFTLVPEREIERVWPSSALPGVTVLTTLAGFVPEEAATMAVPPLDERPLDVGYRGRPLPAWLGRLGQEKKRIAEGFLEHADRLGLRTNIAWQEDARIYGDSWFEFISSCRATLGTESGASITDFDGSLERLVAAYQHDHPDADFEQIHKALLQPYEGNVMMNVISPRIFEAIALRTGLVLFPGEYSGVLEPDRHYIPLAKDFSNIDEAVARIRDSELDAMTQRAYDDIVASGRYSYAAFVRQLDETIDDRAAVRRRPGRRPPLLRYHAARAERTLRAVEQQPLRQARRTARMLAAGRLVVRDPAVLKLALRSIVHPTAIRPLERRTLALDLLRLALLRRANAGRLEAGTPFVLDADLDRETGVLSLVSVASPTPLQEILLATSPDVPRKVRWHHAAVGDSFPVPLTQRHWATFPVDTTGSSPTHDFVALEELANELPRDVARALRPFWMRAEAYGQTPLRVRVNEPPTTPSLSRLPLRMLLHPRYYGTKAAFCVDVLRRYPAPRELLESAYRKGSWRLAVRALPEIMKVHALGLAAAGRADEVESVRAQRDGGELRFVSLTDGGPSELTTGNGAVERIVWDNSRVSPYVVVSWRRKGISFFLGVDGRADFPVLSSLVREDPGVLRTVDALLGQTLRVVPVVPVDG